MTNSYTGHEKVVFGFDLGTTQTAVSYVHLQDAMAPQVKLVTKWPGQEDASGDCKLPTLVQYDSHGQPILYGAEALEQVADDQQGLAKWFKLHLHPASMKANAGTPLRIPPLPAGVTLKQPKVAQVYTHFLKYIYAHATDFFCRHNPDGETIWNRVKDRVEIVFAIPNGWDVAQHVFLRDVVVLSGVLPRGHNPRRIMFWLKPGVNFCVLDAGGSTVDTTLYTCTAVAPKLELEEVTASDCVQAGSVFVDQDAETMLRLKFKGSKFAGIEFIREMMVIFEKKTKRKFDGSDDSSVITFGRNSDNDSNVGINKGRFTLSSDEVAVTFQNAIYDIGESFERVLERANNDCKSLLLVGGFCESPFLRKVLREKNDQRGMQTVTVDDGTKKAAAEGAALWYLKQTVVARATRAHFGTDGTMTFDSSNSHHRERTHLMYKDIDGVQRLRSKFSVWCKKHEIIRTTEPRTFNYTQRWRGEIDIDAALAEPYEVEVFASDQTDAAYWLYDKTGSEQPSHLLTGNRHVCTITADLSALRGSMQLQTSTATGKQFYQLEIKVLVYFGQTALSAEICWQNNGM
ncbi:hypothetical protein BKA62DRAFT_831200 [Auriculariales sp. MPI-PUGE-AT-0066]|nr:hypothetical protein BKA62DRAFT_831200 [Auriculariales sp. MPI-PUGE-AT-0066]